MFNLKNSHKPDFYKTTIVIIAISTLPAMESNKPLIPPDKDFIQTTVKSIIQKILNIPHEDSLKEESQKIIDTAVFLHKKHTLYEDKHEKWKEEQRQKNSECIKRIYKPSTNNAEPDICLLILYNETANNIIKKKYKWFMTFHKLLTYTVFFASERKRFAEKNPKNHTNSKEYFNKQLAQKLMQTMVKEVEGSSFLESITIKGVKPFSDYETWAEDFKYSPTRSERFVNWIFELPILSSFRGIQE